MTTNKSPNKSPNKDLLIARGYETRANKHPGRCAVCGASHEAGAARIARAANLPAWQGRASWVLLCRGGSCTRRFLGGPGVGDSAELIPGNVA